jgi:hypothetical protein
MRFQKSITSITSKLWLSVLVFIFCSLDGLAPNSLPNKASETDVIARQLLDKFDEGDKKGVLVMDSQPSFGEPNSFGPWLADQLASSLASQGQTLTLTDRARIGTGLESLHLAPKDDRTIKNAIALGKSLGANTIILSSYGFAEDGIGVTLAAFRVSEFEASGWNGVWQNAAYARVKRAIGRTSGCVEAEGRCIQVRIRRREHSCLC